MLPVPNFDTPEQAREIISFLRNKIAELEDRLNQSSRNSSVPPSKDNFANKARNTSPHSEKIDKKARRSARA
ncbi:DUF6444 domain-containing protein [Photobacterium sp. SP02]